MPPVTVLGIGRMGVESPGQRRQAIPRLHQSRDGDEGQGTAWTKRHTSCCDWQASLGSKRRQTTATPDNRITPMCVSTGDNVLRETVSLMGYYELVSNEKGSTRLNDLPGVFTHVSNEL